MQGGIVIGDVVLDSPSSPAGGTAGPSSILTPETLKLRSEPAAGCACYESASAKEGREMEQHQIVDAMTGLNISGMRKGQGRREEIHPGLESWLPRPESTLSGPAFGMPPTRASSLDEVSIERAEFLGLSFDAVTMETAVARCLEFCCAPRASHVVFTANASHLCMMRHDAELALACRAAHLTVADGMSVVWAVRASGQPAPERVAGIDLMDRLLAAAAKHRLSVYFLGARREVVETLVKNSRIRYPGVEIAGFRDGYFGPKDHQVIVEEIRASGAHILFVGMPSPFKETWCERHRERLDVPVIMGVGGSFDVLAGYIRRAPHWMQSAGLEWFWRLLMEPRKLWRRYLATNSEFVWLACQEIVARRMGRQPAIEGHR
jgi:N-acetylglucosaminyldiphosphoundecaprenol N-acetyl-beta-D-mannosaminyltransferase